MIVAEDAAGARGKTVIGCRRASGGDPGRVFGEEILGWRVWISKLPKIRLNVNIAYQRVL